MTPSYTDEAPSWAQRAEAILHRAASAIWARILRVCPSAERLHPALDRAWAWIWRHTEE